MLPLVTAGLACLFALLLGGVLGVQQCRAGLPGSALLTAVGCFGLANAIQTTGARWRVGVLFGLEANPKDGTVRFDGAPLSRGLDLPQAWRLALRAHC